ncbi:MAG: anti-sigma factor, partial [Catalinimonas sp.]
RAVVYADSGRAYLQVVDLPVPPAGKQYQLWGIAGGQPVSMGVFNLPTGGAELQAVAAVPNAQAYAVTLEPTGGSPTPTLDQMYVMGEI